MWRLGGAVTWLEPLVQLHEHRGLALQVLGGVTPVFHGCSPVYVHHWFFWWAVKRVQMTAHANSLSPKDITPLEGLHNRDMNQSFCILWWAAQMFPGCSLEYVYHLSVWWDMKFCNVQFLPAQYALWGGGEIVGGIVIMTTLFIYTVGSVFYPKVKQL